MVWLFAYVSRAFDKLIKIDKQNLVCKKQNNKFAYPINEML